MDRWIVISNCQTFGLANSLQAQVDDVEVKGIDSALFQSNPIQYTEELSRASLLIYVPWIQGEMPQFNFESVEHRIAIPTISIRAYHPDLVYLRKGEGGFVSGPSNDYHSAIVFAAYNNGLTVQDTLQLFNGKFFEKCHYFNWWPSERDRQIQDFRNHDLDISIPIRRWGRSDAFMYSNNHPKIRCLYDVASIILAKLGRTPRREGVYPHDNLASGAYFPVYPEIAETLGVAGCYRFKRLGTYQHIGLSEYIEQCFASYGTLPPNTVQVHEEFRQSYECVLAAFSS